MFKGNQWNGMDYIVRTAESIRVETIRGRGTSKIILINLIKIN